MLMGQPALSDTRVCYGLTIKLLKTNLFLSVYQTTSKEKYEMFVESTLQL